jgi:hypothetical protein
VKKLLSVCVSFGLLSIAGCGDPPKPVKKDEPKKEVVTPAATPTDSMPGGEKKDAKPH